MHRPLINWKKNALVEKEGGVEHTVFSTTQKLIKVRKEIPVLADKSNITWLRTNNKHVAGFLRAWDQDRVYCLFNFSSSPQTIKNWVFKEHGMTPSNLYDHWSDTTFDINSDFDEFFIAPFKFFILSP
jgi:amylosucrase